MTEELSPSQAAVRLGATTRSVQRWIASGRLSARRVGGRWRVASDALDAFSTLPPATDSIARTIAEVFIANRVEIARRIERTCRELGIVAVIPLVGPPASAIEAMGDKAAARKIAASLGVPVLPGYDGDDQSDDALGRAASEIGFPLLVKPAAGGGGKGMRVVGDGDELRPALVGARREARAAFGDDRLVLERRLDGARHVEIQVLFDELGN